MDFFDEATVCSIIGEGTTSLCLFASYDTSNRVSDNLIEYVTQLKEHFDKVLFLTNPRGTTNGQLENEGSLRCKVVYVPNQCQDFGMWYRLLHRFPDIYNLKRLALVNDSCFIVNDLSRAFKRAAETNLVFWGLLKSDEVSPHVQTFFVVMDSVESVKWGLKFFNDQVMPTDITRHDLVHVWEIGLSRHMAEQFEVSGVYSMQDVLKVAPARSAPSNASVYYWDVLLYLGYPLMKRNRKNVSTAIQVITDRIHPYYLRTMNGAIGSMF